MSINSEADVQAILNQLRECDRILNKPNVLFSFKNESNSIKEAFNEARVKLATKIREIENRSISELLRGLQNNESSLQQGINNLNREIKAGNNIAKITEGIDRVLKVVTDLLPGVRRIVTRNLYALFVGIDEYLNPDVPTLQGCKNDIKAIETYLRSQIAGEWKLFEPVILTDKEATREKIIDGFQNYLCQAGSDDIALFYYSGHGGQEKAPQEFFGLEPDGLNETLVCYDSRTQGNYDLADKELRYLLTEVAKNNPRVIVILDCCHSGSGTRDVPQGVRLAPEVTTERDISSFIFAEDKNFKRILDTSEKVEKKKIGLSLPTGKHILFAACGDSQYAKEYHGDDGEVRGAFSYFFLKTLEQNSGSLSYLDLSRNIEALVSGKVQDQIPRIEASNLEDLKESFLGGAIPERPFYFTLSYSTNKKKSGWEIDAGAIQGIPKPSLNQESTILAIFPVGSNSDDLKQFSKACGRAKVTKVLTQESNVEITEGEENLDKNTTYWAVVISLPIKPLKVYIPTNVRENTAIVSVNKALETANNGQNSLYVKKVEDSTDSDFTLLAENGQYWITQDESPVIAPIPKEPGYSEDAAKKAIQALEAIARWTNILELKSTNSSINPNDVEMEITKYGYEDSEGEIKLYEGADKSLSKASGNFIEYKYEDGEWKRPVVKVKLTNHTRQKLYCSLLLLSSDYSVDPRIHNEPDPEYPNPYPEAIIELFGKTEDTNDTRNIFESIVFFQIKEEFLDSGITEEEDIFKLIVSNTRFNADLLQQDGLEPPPPKETRSIDGGTLDSLMLQVSTRGGAKSRRRIDDWITKEMALTIIKPRDVEQLQPNRSVTLLNGLVEVEPHLSLQAKVTLTTVSQTTRDIGNLIFPPILRDEKGVIESFQFTSSRSSDPGLSAVELFDVNNHKLVTKDTPLTLRVNRVLEEGEYLLPVSYDGECFLPLGSGFKKGKQTEIKLERLPLPFGNNRSLNGSIKIFFKKFRSQKLGTSYDYPILAAADVTEEGNKIKVVYEKEREEVKKRVAAAQKIVLYIHGIIGDTESLVGSIQQAKVEVNNQQRPLQELYDLVLTFDYENLHTTIQENGELLKQRLQAVGLGANHGKELHIVAHSMGGLVSRWFIERQGGNQIVQHLVMLGTPNAGYPWPTVQDMSFTLLSWGLNQIPEMIWPAKVVADLVVNSLEFVETNDNALDQMQFDSVFLKEINAPALGMNANSSQVQVPYTIIAGDRSISTSKQKLNILGLLKEKLFTPIVNKVVDDLVFGKEANDIAVSLASIKNVNRDNRISEPRILDVACDHMTYFTTEAGLKALADTLVSNRN